MPAHKADEGRVCRTCGHNAAREKYITKLLLAAVKKAGGELRLPACDVDVLSEMGVLAKDYDSKKQEVVLRLSSQFADFFVVRPDVEEMWSEPRQTQPQAEQPKTDGKEPPTRRVIITDEQAARIEQALLARKQATKEAQEEQERLRRRPSSRG